MTRSVVEWGMAARPAAGETESGDGCTVRELDGCVLAAAMDALGHGSEAARATRGALDALNEADPATLGEAAELCHRALKHTRGAALTMAAFDPRSDEMTWLGVGNVQARLLRAGAVEGEAASLLLRPGIAGEDMPVELPRTTQVRRGDLLVLATDGVAPSFDRDISAEGSCEDIARGLLEHHARAYDDALVLVVRYLGAGR